jgi:alginate O-acetyltransferase complex protein AlgJ
MAQTTVTPPEPLPSAATAHEQGLENTRYNPLPGSLRRLPGIFLLVTLLLGLGAALLTPETWRWPNRGSFWRGEQAARYERAFNEGLPFRETAIATWGVLEYALFGEGREGVVVGEDGWLFTAEEVTFYEGAAAETARKLDVIASVQAQLAARDVALVVALVPDKARVYAQRLGHPLPSYTRNRYQTFRRELISRGILAPDLLTPLLEAKTRQQVYLRTDTHWTPAGAEVAAEAVARALAGRDIPNLFETGYRTETTGHEPYEGDLLNFLPLGTLQDRLGPPPDRLETRQTQAMSTAAADTGGGLFGAQTIPVTLIGTSYSATPNWNFAGALQEALGAEVLNLAAEGQGPLPPMREYLKSTELKGTPPALVVWELPERYIPVADAREAL